MAGQYIGRDKLRAAVRKMGTEYVFRMLDDAITLLPERKLRKLIAQYLKPVWSKNSNGLRWHNLRFPRFSSNRFR
jgi:hypothetical protein